jgi:hypothetical protein
MFALTSGNILVACKHFFHVIPFRILLSNPHIGMATCTKDTPGRAIGLLVAGCTLIGYTETVVSVTASICVKDQREIGTAMGLGGSMRATLSTFGATVYTVVLNNRIASTIPAQVPPALVKAGLPSTSVGAFIAAVSVGTDAAFAAVPGISAEIKTIGVDAYKVASADAYRTVFLTTCAFSGIGLILSFFAPDVGTRMNHDVVATLHDTRTQNIVGRKKTETGVTA